MSDIRAGGAPSGEKSFLGHPRGLVVLFITEMWERFSYYGMRALLTLYLIQHFLFSDDDASYIYGAYIALVYVMSLIGGILSDKYLGQRKAVTYGAILLVLGHFGMAFEGSGSKQYVSFNGTEYVIEDEGRDKNRKLYIDYEGETRQLVFDSYTTATLGERELTPVEVDVADDGTETTTGDYRIERTNRSVLQRICALASMSCAGPEPSVTLLLDDQSYNVVTREVTETVTKTVDGEEVEEELTVEKTFVEMDGSDVLFEETSTTDLEIVDFGADKKSDEDDTVLATISCGEKDDDKCSGYKTRDEKQQLYVYILFLSLSLIIAGVGFLKPNISTIVGDLYKKGDERRDAGFTLFYMGINLGSFLSTWTCGILGIYYGWAWGFGLAGVGMLAGLIVFLAGQSWLEGKAEPPEPAKLKEKVLGPINVEWACYSVGLGIVVLSMILVANAQYVGNLMAAVGVLMFVGLIGYSLVKLRGNERSRMWAGVYFALAQVPFWSLFEQAGSSLTLFTSRLVDTNIFGWNVPTPVFQSLNAGFIFIFAPMVAWLWIWLNKRGWEPSTPVKFAFGVFGAGLGYLALVAGMNTTGPGVLTPVFFIFAIYWIHTMAELLLSPVGLSAMTKLAPARAVGLMMGAWFLYSGLGNAMSGVIASMAGSETVGGEIVDKVAAKENYALVFGNVGWIGMGIGVLMLLVAPIVKGWMRMDVDADVSKEGADPSDFQGKADKLDDN